MPVHAELPAPGENGIGRELHAIVADDHAGLAALGDKVGQFTHEPAS